MRNLAAFAAVLLLFTLPVQAAEAPSLTFARVFAAPDPEGPHLGSVKYAPNGQQIAYLKGSPEAARTLDLWLYDPASGANERVVAASVLPVTDRDDPLLRSERERRRINTDGITDFEWAPAGDAILIPWDGGVFLYRLATRAVTPIRTGPGAIADPRLSPTATKLAYVRDGDLYVLDLASGREKRLTERAHDLVQNGVAEFIAAEEMSRQAGYWWAPDGEAIAYVEADMRAMQGPPRYDILAASVRRNPEPYPFAGTANASVRLGIIEVKNGRRRWVALTESGESTDFYLARVIWLADSKSLLVEREARDQKTLDLLLFARDGQRIRRVLRETSPAWINLNNDLTVLVKGQSLVWASERSGSKQLFLYGLDGTPEGALTPPTLFIDGVAAIDEAAGRLYVHGYQESPLDKHLFAVDLDPATADSPVQLTSGAGWHTAILAPNGRSFVDLYSNPEAPLSLSLHGLDGGALDGSTPTLIVDGRIGPGHPYFPYLASHRHPSFGTLQAADGSALHYRLFQPEPKTETGPGRRYPVLLHLYGGPTAQLVTRAWPPLWYQAALARGYVVFSLDNRGTARRGQQFEQAIGGEFGPVEVADQQAGIRYLKTLPFVDPERIAVFGWSFGGYLALKLAEAGPGVNAAAAGAPVTDWRLYDTHYTERYLGLPATNPEGYTKSGVFTDLDRLTPPLLLIHGMADDNVLFTHATKLMAALQARPQPFTLMTYPGVTHLFRDPKLQTHLYETMFDFFDATFARRPPPPAKKANAR